MTFRSLAVAMAISCILIGASSITTTAVALDSNGIDIEGTKNWRIYENPGKTGGWIWEAGGNAGKSSTRQGARKAARKAAKAARKAGRNSDVIANQDCTSPDTPPCQ